MIREYETVIGLEVHVELNTKMKIFCGCSTEFGAEPNTHICPVCTGMPGALPVLNKKVVEYALAAGEALHCRVNRRCRFDRKKLFLSGQSPELSDFPALSAHLPGWVAGDRDR